jgi:hypothetical protein
MKHHENEQYITQIPESELQRDYFQFYNYNFWMHKANAVLTFIENPDRIKDLRFEEDRDIDEYILENLKMELHMMVFHSSESLFLNIFAIIYQPNFPWVWVSRCSFQKLNDLIDKVKRKGLSLLKENPEIWLRDNLYPSIISEQHKNYEKSKLSSIFVTRYLEALAGEYIDHAEYNSYKHGLRGFPGNLKLQAIDEKDGHTVFDSHNDFIEFLQFTKESYHGKMHTRIKLIKKTYNYKRDLRIVRMNSIILCNLFHAKKIMIQNHTERKQKVGYYLLHDWSLNDIFNRDSNAATSNTLTKFSM